MKRQSISGLCLVLVSLCLAAQASAQTFTFATREEASRFLSAPDDFTDRLSAFDRGARLKTGRSVSPREFLEFVASSALEWRPAEKERVRKALASIEPALARVGLPLPDSIRLIKTSGREEGNAAYTRGNSVILPAAYVGGGKNDLSRILAHELFHIATRAHQDLAVELYATIGFHPCAGVALPSELEPRRLTNPDAPRTDQCIRVELGTEHVLVAPVLYSSAARYNPARGGEFFDYLVFAFLVMEGSRQGQLVSPGDLHGFFEQVGRNTSYIIHPEEILADNFAALVKGSDELPSPEVTERLRRTLSAHAQSTR